MSQSDRDVLFANEQFVIGISQAVSGASIVATLAQVQSLSDFVGPIPVRIAFTLFSVSLLLAVLAAYWKHQYKLWDVKAQAAAARNETTDAAERARRSQVNLVRMRTGLSVSVSCIVLAIAVLVIGSWWTLVTAA